jgi:hypothetical protein
MKDSSHRNFLIALGVAVAAIIVFTAFYFSDGSLTLNRNSGIPPLQKKATPQVIIKKISDNVIPFLRSFQK